MKKVALVLMICVYALSSFGVGVKQFYCCGKLESTTISFVQDAKGKCGKGNENNECCKTNFKSLKVKDSHIAAGDVSSPVKHFTNLYLFIPSFAALALANEPLEIANASNAPPLHHCIPVYIVNRNFRI